jgi:hypothetical protein
VSEFHQAKCQSEEPDPKESEEPDPKENVKVKNLTPNRCQSEEPDPK